MFQKRKFKIMALMTIFSLTLCSVGKAAEPISVSGRILQPSQELGDSSKWMEIARYDKFSLILRLECLPDKVPYDSSGVYQGYLDSNAQNLVHKWFLNLKGILKDASVGNNAELNLGFYYSPSNHSQSFVYNYDRPREAKGTGFSIPQPSKTPSAFILSYQEARQFAFAQCGSGKVDPATYANCRILYDSREETKSFLGFKLFKRKLKLPPETSWLRSPGDKKNYVSCCGPICLDGRNLFELEVSCPQKVRPAIWVKSYIFDGTRSLSEDYMHLLSSIDNEENRRKVANLLISEKYYRDFCRECKRSCVNPRIHILLEEAPDMTVIQNLVDTYFNMEILKSKEIVKFSDSDISSLSACDLDKFAVAKVTEAEGKTLFVDISKVLSIANESADGLNEKIRNFIDTLMNNKCFIIMANSPPEFKEFLKKNEWYDAQFESLNFSLEANKEITMVSKPDKPTIDECLQPLDSLVGMENFKKLIRSSLHDFKVHEIDAKIGVIRETPGFNMVLTGNPGTGKTTVAKMLGDILFKAGVIKKNVVVKVERADLVGKYQGHTEAFVRDKLKEAEDGILFIDEAYSLAAGGAQDFGQRAIEGLLTPLTTNECIIIAAGYTEEMEAFLRSNTGLRGRFDYEINLKDYKPAELLQIFKNLCAKSNLILESGVEKSLLELFESIHKGPDFSNARYVHKVYETIMRIRSMNLTIDVDADLLTEQEIKERKQLKADYVEDAKKELLGIL